MLGYLVISLLGFSHSAMAEYEYTHQQNQTQWSRTEESSTEICERVGTYGTFGQLFGSHSDAADGNRYLGRQCVQAIQRQSRVTAAGGGHIVKGYDCGIMETFTAQSFRGARAAALRSANSFCEGAGLTARPLEPTQINEQAPTKAERNICPFIAVVEFPFECVASAKSKEL